MPAKPWATPAQLEWMEARVPDFLEARQDNDTNGWYMKTYHQFFEAFPVPAPTEAAIAIHGNAAKAIEAAAAGTRKQLYWWYQNHTRGTGSGGAAKRPKVLKLDKKRRQMQAVHAYIHLHKEKVLPIIEERWMEYIKARATDEPQLKWIAFYDKEARELLAKESDEVKAAVEQFRKAPNAPAAGDVIPVEPGKETTQQRKVMDMQQAIEGLARTLQIAFDNVREQTGWIGTVLLGGPDPRSGSYSSLIYHTGTSIASGSRWDQSHEKWEEIEKSFGDFVRTCYPPNHLEQLSATYKSCFNRDPTPEEGPRGEDRAESQEMQASTSGSSGNLPDAHPASGNGVQQPAAPPAASSPAVRPTVESPPASCEPTTPTTPTTPATPTTSSAETPVEPAPTPVNDFEAEREENIRRNQTLLTNLGLANTNRAKPVSEPKKRAPRSGRKATNKPQSTSQRSLRPRDKDNIPEPTPENPAADIPSPAAISEDDAEDNTNTDLPQWMQLALERLRPLSDDQKWGDLLDYWVLHEKELGFPTGQGAATRVSKTGRPEEVDWWLRVGRRDYDKQPDIKDVPQYSAQWKEWWMGLQPEWRGTTWPPQRVDTAGDGNWDDLRRGGCNAVFLVIMALSWWYGKVASSAEDKADALLAVDEVTFALRSMQPRASAKRRHDDSEEPTSNKRPALSV